MDQAAVRRLRLPREGRVRPLRRPAPVVCHRQLTGTGGLGTGLPTAGNPVPNGRESCSQPVGNNRPGRPGCSPGRKSICRPAEKAGVCDEIVMSFRSVGLCLSFSTLYTLSWCTSAEKQGDFPGFSPAPPLHRKKIRMASSGFPSRILPFEKPALHSEKNKGIRQ